MLSDWTIHAVGSLHMGNVARAPYARVNVLTGFFFLSASLVLSIVVRHGEILVSLYLPACLPVYSWADEIDRLPQRGLPRRVECAMLY